MAEDVLLPQTTVNVGSSDRDYEDGSGTLAPTMSTYCALSSIDSLIELMHTKGQQDVFAQQLEAMHNVVMPRKQVKISDFLGIS